MKLTSSSFSDNGMIPALMMLELGKAPVGALHWFGGALVVLRLLHAFYALNKGPFWVAVAVAVPHYTLLAVMGVWSLVLHFKR